MENEYLVSNPTHTNEPNDNIQLKELNIEIRDKNNFDLSPNDINKNNEESNFTEEKKLNHTELNKESVEFVHQRDNKTGQDSMHEKVNDMRERIFLNSHPEYSLNLSMLFYYVLLFHLNNKVVIFVRRFLFLYIMWAATGFMAFVVFNFYNSILDDLLFVSKQGRALVNLVNVVYQTEYEKFLKEDPTNIYGIQSLYMLVLYMPLCLSALQMLLLFFIFLDGQDMCETLYWGHEEKILNLHFQHEFSDIIHNLVTKSPQRILYERMKYRFILIFSKDFWFSMWKKLQSQSNRKQQHHGAVYRKINRQSGSNVRLSSQNEPVHNKEDLDQSVSVGNSSQEIGSCFVIFFKAIVVFPIVALVVGFPIVSMWSNVIVNTHVLIPKCCRSNRINAEKSKRIEGNNCETCSNSPILWLTFPLTILGIILFLILVVDFTVLYCQAVLFLFIDVFRHSEDLLSKCIFIMSVFFYVKQAFVRFEDGYRSMKLFVFEICENINSEFDGKACLQNDDEDEMVSRDGTPLIVQYEDGHISIPKQIFIDICEKYMPYKRQVFKCFIELFASISAIIFLFLIALEFQVFAEFSTFGETVFTMATMSVPYLCSIFRSEVYASLVQAKVNKEIEASIRGCMIQQTDSHV